MPYDKELNMNYSINTYLTFAIKQHGIEMAGQFAKSLKKLLKAFDAQEDYPFDVLKEKDVKEALDSLYDYLSKRDKTHFYFREMNSKNIYKIFYAGFHKKNPTQNEIDDGIDCLKNFFERNDYWCVFAGGRYGPPIPKDWDNHNLGSMFCVEREYGYVSERNLKKTIKNLFNCKIKEEYELLIELPY